MALLRIQVDEDLDRDEACLRVAEEGVYSFSEEEFGKHIFWREKK
jgi:hypothetical protein